MTRISPSTTITNELDMPSEFARRASLSLFGVRIEVESNSQDALDAARACISRGNEAEFLDATNSSAYVVLKLYDVNQPIASVEDHAVATALHWDFEPVAALADPTSGCGIC